MAIYQAFAAPIADTVGHFQAYAQFFGGGFTTIGWLNLSGAGTVNTSGTAVTWVSGTTFAAQWAGSSIVINGVNYTIATVNSGTSITLTGSAGSNSGVAYNAGFGILPNNGSTGSSYAFSNPVIPGTTAMAAVALYTYRGQWVSGQTYPNGSNSAAGMADLVTDNSSGGNGITYVKITTNTATNLTTAPHSNATDWAPYQYEIWVSQGSNSATLPIYVRIGYVSASSTALRLHFTVGTGIDANGNVTGGVTLAASSPVSIPLVDNGSSSSSTISEMDMSGDSDNVRMFIQRAASAGYQGTVVIDRSRTTSGVATNAFVYVGVNLNKAGTWTCGGGLLFNSSINSTISQSIAGWVGAQTGGASTLNLALNGGIPPFFIYPMVGYQAPPLLGAVGFHRLDVSEGSVIYVWNYGAMHAYLVTTFAGSSTALTAIDNQNPGVYAAILWE